MKIVQIQFRVKSDEIDNRPVYLVGSFNNWKPADPAYKMHPQGEEGIFQLTIYPKLIQGEVLEYKYTKGDWSEVELERNGRISPNRKLKINSDRIYQEDEVHKWRRNWLPFNEQKLPKLETFEEAIDMYPFEGRTRRVRVVLPYNYSKTDTHYPVLYLQDGQNLVDGGSEYGNWDLEKRLAVLTDYDRSNLIVVVIDHGNEKRATEYNFNNNTGKLGAQEGKLYLRFLVDNLKPKIDAKYRTLKDRENTGIGGSSLGGLISIYAGVIYPEVFSKMMIFSPSIWAMPQLKFPEVLFYNEFPSKWYFYSGKKESPRHFGNVERFQRHLQKVSKAFVQMDLRFSIHQEGTHSEIFWADEFPKAVEWLFYDTLEDPSTKQILDQLFEN